MFLDDTKLPTHEICFLRKKEKKKDPKAKTSRSFVSHYFALRINRNGKPLFESKFKSARPNPTGVGWIPYKFNLPTHFSPTGLLSLVVARSWVFQYFLSFPLSTYTLRILLVDYSIEVLNFRVVTHKTPHLRTSGFFFLLRASCLGVRPMSSSGFLFPWGKLRKKWVYTLRFCFYIWYMG